MRQYVSVCARWRACAVLLSCAILLYDSGVRRRIWQTFSVTLSRSTLHSPVQSGRLVRASAAIGSLRTHRDDIRGGGRVGMGRVSMDQRSLYAACW